MFINDKKACRGFYSCVRKSLTAAERGECDRRILSYLINSELYRSCDLLLTYVSVGTETDTRDLISSALAVGKRVAVPVCEGRKMSFFEIDSQENLKIGKFGIPTADKSAKPVQTYDEGALCIVPALAFDRSMNRLGMGGGYYDRFFAENSLLSIGICCERCFADRLPAEPHDMKVRYVLTENGFKNAESSNFKEVSTYE